MNAINSEVPNCLILEKHIPDLDGLRLFRMLLRRGFEMPTIFLTESDDLDSAVEAMRLGAFDFIRKSSCSKTITISLQNALDFDSDRLEKISEQLGIKQQVESLSQAETKVMDRVVQGDLNKRIAFDLDISERAVEYRRSSLMKKLGVATVAELVRKVVAYENLDKSSVPMPHYLTRSRKTVLTNRESISQG